MFIIREFQNSKLICWNLHFDLFGRSVLRHYQMHGDQQIHVETRVKREMAPLIKFKCICYCFQHLVIDVYICRECVLCVGITNIYMCNYINICMFLFQIFFLSKNLDFNSDQSSKLNFYLFKIYWMLLYERFCMFVTYMFLCFFSNMFTL